MRPRIRLRLGGEVRRHVLLLGSMPNVDEAVGALNRHEDARRASVRSLASGKVSITIEMEPEVMDRVTDPAYLNVQNRLLKLRVIIFKCTT